MYLSVNEDRCGSCVPIHSEGITPLYIIRNIIPSTSRVLLLDSSGVYANHLKLLLLPTNLYTTMIEIAKFMLTIFSALRW